MKIPDDVFQNRCQYCHHGRPGAENLEIPNDKLFYHYWVKDSPCQIIGIAQCGKVQGECLSFAPNPMFGICLYCEFTNQFHDGYCTFPGGPKNKRRVFLGENCLAEYYRDHGLSICDHYRPSSYWKDIIMRYTLEGRAPQNFDPDTWKPLERIDGAAAAKHWAELQEKQAEVRAAEEKAAQEKKDAESEKQLSIFDG